MHTRYRQIAALETASGELVERRAAVKNQLHALPMGQGSRWRRKLWTVRGRQALESLRLLPWTSRRH